MHLGVAVVRDLCLRLPIIRSFVRSFVSSWPAARATGTQCLMNRRACGGAAARHHLSAATTAACQSAAAGHLGTVPESQLMLARTNETVMLMKRPVAGWNMNGGGIINVLPCAFAAFIQATEGLSR